MTGDKEKRVLSAIYVTGLRGTRSTLKVLCGATGLGKEEVAGALAEAARRKLVEGGRLTVAGRRRIRVVMVGGGFEIIHPGHVHTLKSAKALGDALVVVVARDETIARRKGREPVTKESERVELLSALKMVDAVILGDLRDIYKTLERVRPDVVALGYDQHHQEEDIVREAKKRGMDVRVVRLGTPIPGVKASRIISET